MIEELITRGDMYACMKDIQMHFEAHSHWEYIQTTRATAQLKALTDKPKKNWQDVSVTS